jgi:creatinine amidohydrolase
MANLGIYLEELSWPEAEQILNEETLLVVPLGAAAKEHGLHLKLKNDLILAQYFTRRLVEQMPVVVAPVVSYHFYPAFAEYPGSTSLRLEVARDLIIDICQSFSRFKVRRFYILNTGYSTIRALEPAVGELSKQGLIVHYTKPQNFESLDKEVLQQKGGSHADEAETSMMLYIAPETVDMTKAVKDYDSQGKGPLTRQKGSEGTYSPSGVYGDATLATVEKGRVIVEARVKEIVKEVKLLAEIKIS